MRPCLSFLPVRVVWVSPMTSASTSSQPCILHKSTGIVGFPIIEVVLQVAMPLECFRQTVLYKRHPHSECSLMQRWKELQDSEPTPQLPLFSSFLPILTQCIIRHQISSRSARPTPDLCRFASPHKRSKVPTSCQVKCTSGATPCRQGIDDAWTFRMSKPCLTNPVEILELRGRTGALRDALAGPLLPPALIDGRP